MDPRLPSYQDTIMDQPTIERSILTMPLPGMKQAPKTFHGHAEQLSIFLIQYERLATYHQLSDADKCTTVGEYCSERVRETIAGFRSYRSRQWTQLKKDIENAYDLDKVTKRFTKLDLHDLCKRFSKEVDRPLYDLSAWKIYLQDFVRIAGALESNGHLTETEHAIYFWLGIPKRIQRKIEPTIRARLPDHDITTPFPEDEVTRSIEDLFCRNRFDKTLIVWDTTDTEDLETRNAKSDTDSDSDEEDIVQPSSQSNRLPDYWNPNQQQHKKTSSAVSALHSEVEHLIVRMTQLDTADPQYRLLYYKALKLDPDIASCVVQPSLVATAQSRITVPIQTPNRTSKTSTSSITNRTCWGCGQQGHHLQECSSVLRYIEHGKIIKNNYGHFLDLKGQRITRQQDETWIEAFDTAIAQTHLATVNPEPQHDMYYPMYYSLPQMMQPAARNAYNPVQSLSANTKDRLKKEAPKIVRPDNAIDNIIRSRYDPICEPRPVLQEVASPTSRNISRPPLDTQVSSDPDISSIPRIPSPTVIAKKILDTPLTFTIEEILGSSSELQNQLSQAQKNVPPVQPVQPAPDSVQVHVVQEAKEESIYFPMLCDNVLIDFHLDLFSDLNLLSEDVWRSLNIPLDEDLPRTICTPKGETQIILGRVDDLVLKHGPVQTPTTFYVVPSMDSEGILGKPWILHHRVKIALKNEQIWFEFPQSRTVPSGADILTNSRRLQDNELPAIFGPQSTRPRNVLPETIAKDQEVDQIPSNTLTRVPGKAYTLSTAAIVSSESSSSISSSESIEPVAEVVTSHSKDTLLNIESDLTVTEPMNRVNIDLYRPRRQVLPSFRKPTVPVKSRNTVAGKPCLQHIGTEHMHRDKIAMHASLWNPTQEMITSPHTQDHQSSWNTAARVPEKPPDIED